MQSWPYLVRLTIACSWYLNVRKIHGIRGIYVRKFILNSVKLLDVNTLYRVTCTTNLSWKKGSGKRS